LIFLTVTIKDGDERDRTSKKETKNNRIRRDYKVKKNKLRKWLKR